MPNYDMGTAHGRIRIDYDGDGPQRAREDMDRAREGSREFDDGLKDNIKTFAAMTTRLVAMTSAFAPMVAAGVAAAGTIGAAFVSAGAALGAFRLAVQPQVSAIQDLSSAHDAYQKAVQKSGASSTAAQGALKLYNEQLKTMTPATRGTAVAFLGLKDDFQKWSDSLSSTTMPIFTRGIQLLRSLLPALTPLVKAAAGALSNFMTSLENGAKGGGVQRFAQELATQATNVLPKFLNSIKNIAIGVGGLIRAFVPLSTTMTGGIEEMTAKFAAFGKNVGTSGGFATFIQNMRTQGPLVGKLLRDLGTIVINLVKAFAPFAGATTGLTVALAGLVAAIPIPILRTLIAVITTISVAMKVYAAVQVVVTAATKAWAIAQVILNSAFLTNPFTLTIIAIIALGAAIVLLWKKSETFRNIVLGVWNAIKTGVTAAVSFVVNFVKNHWQLLLAIMLGPLGIILGQVIKHWNAIKNFVVGAVTAVINFVRDHWRLIITIIAGPLGLIFALVTKYWTQIRNFITSIVNAIVNVIRGFNNRVVSIVRSIGNIVGIIAGVFNRFNQAIISRVSSVLNTLRGVPGRIFNIFSGAGNWLWNAGQRIIQGLINGIVSMFNRLQSTLNSVTRVIPSWKGPPQKDAKLLIENGRLIMGSLIRGFEDWLPKVQATLTNVTNVMQTTTASALPPVAFANSALGAANTGLPASLSATATLPSDLVDRLVDALQRAGVGATYIDGQLVSSVVGRIQGRTTSFQRRTR